eukprot:scaffold15603_cov65-Phaeocystis_antarctica.AAC.1
MDPAPPQDRASNLAKSTSQRSLRGAWSRSLYTGPFHGQMFTRTGMPSQGNLHCARRCRALGEQLGAMRSRCDYAAL